MLFTPEEDIITQGDMNFDMYFIATGIAYGKIKDKIGREKPLKRKFEQGSHFGDISLFYNCPRTATIVSGDFSTCARLSKAAYNLLIQQLPEV